MEMTFEVSKKKLQIKEDYESKLRTVSISNPTMVTTIPVDIVRLLGLKEGDLMQYHLEQTDMGDSVNFDLKISIVPKK